MIDNRNGNVSGMNVRRADRHELMASFDSLPARTRFALGECIPNWDSREAAAHIRSLLIQGWTLQQADAEMARLIYEADENNILRFARQSGCHGHVMAGATVVRYHDAAGY